VNIPPNPTHRVSTQPIRFKSSFYPGNPAAAYTAPPGTSVNLLNFSPPTGIGTNRFAVLGDAGTGDRAQYDVARQMSRWRSVMPYGSVLVLGDNVYQNGETAFFYDRLFKPYQDLFAQGVKFLPVLGNHDVKAGTGDDQMAFWGVPSYYKFQLGPKGSEVEFFAIDTTIMAPGKSGCYENNPWVAQQRAAMQMAWLEKSLAESKAPMKVVFGHYPMFSKGVNGKPGRSDTQIIMEQQLAPLFSKYGVDLYMAGHEHHYERPTLVNGVYYLVSGAGGKLDTPMRGGIEGDGLIKKNHFMLFEIAPEGLKYQTVSAQGEIFDSGLIPRKNRFAAYPPAWQFPQAR
jgi:hypothetical protein